MKKINIQFLYNCFSSFFISLLIVVMFIGYHIQSGIYKNEIDFLNLKHSLNVEKIKEEMLTNDPLSLTKYFESQSLITSYLNFVNPELTKSDAEEIISAIEIESKTYPRVTEAMLLFTSQIESDFNKNAKSKDGALGLMQVMPSVWLESENPDNEDNLSAISIQTREQLQTIEGSIAAGAWILNIYSLQCEEQEKNHPKMFHLKHNTIAECTSKKYFGGNHKWYFGRLKKAAGNFWFWITSKDDTSKKPKTNEFDVRSIHKQKVSPA